MLATVERLKKMLHIPDSDKTEDDELVAVITAASDAIETRLRRKLERAERTEKYDGTGRDQLLLNQFPVLSVSEVKIEDSAVTNFESIIESGMLFRADMWPRGRRNISVKYTAGYNLPGGTEESTLPKSIEQACLILARMLYTGEWGKTEERMGSYSAKYTVYEGTHTNLPPVVVALTEPFVRRLV